MQQDFKEQVFSHYVEDIARLVDKNSGQKSPIWDNCNKTAPIIIAIDGRSASGKTSFADMLSNRLSCPVIHTDDFYLPLVLRTEQIMQSCFGHMDLERLRTEVLLPLSQGRTASYRPFSCKSQTFLEEIRITPPRVAIIEGTYSLFPTLTPYYDIKIFLDTKSQRERLLAREGEEGLLRFSRLWIPREEEYISTVHPEGLCDFVIEN